MKKQYYLYLFILLTAIYMGLVVLLPPDPTALAKYNLTASSARLLSLAVVIPYVIVWMVALYGFMRIKSYALIVRETTEGKPFNHLANGLMVLAFSLPITAIISSVLTYYSQHNPDLVPLVTITRNYVNLAFSIVVFMILFKAAEEFLITLKGNAQKLLALPVAFIPIMVVLSSIFTWLVVARPVSVEVNSSSYFLPNWLLIFTLVIPYLIVWYMGALTSYRLYVYMTKVKGRIYQSAFKNLAIGAAGIVGTSIFIQIVTTLSARISRLKLTPILLLIYVLVFLYAVGFIFVARGAKKLKQIEEV